MRLAVAIQMTYVGAPMIYYGDEAGMWGEDDPGVRKPMLWDDITYETETGHPSGLPRPSDPVAVDHSMLDYYKSAITLRNSHAALRRGDFEVILVDDEKEILAFSRSLDQDKLIIAINNADESRSFRLPEIAGWKKIFTMGTATSDDSGILQLGRRTLVVFNRK